MKSIRSITQLLSPILQIIMCLPRVQIFFAHRFLSMGKKIKYLCALRASVVKKSVS